MTGWEFAAYIIGGTTLVTLLALGFALFVAFAKGMSDQG